MTLILASASPRRAQLLHQANILFKVEVSPAREPARKPELVPTEIWPSMLAYMKACAVYARHRKAGAAPIILGADTIVVSPEGKIVNKARDRAHARQILGSLSGKTHTVITGICLMKGGHLRMTSARATCKMKRLTAREMGAYLDSGLWKGKAGAYGLQDAVKDPFVTLLSGHPTTVIGLPIPLLQAELAGFPSV
jgi:septum formation protein